MNSRFPILIHCVLSIAQVTMTTETKQQESKGSKRRKPKKKKKKKKKQQQQHNVGSEKPKKEGKDTEQPAQQMQKKKQAEAASGKQKKPKTKKVRTNDPFSLVRNNTSEGFIIEEKPRRYAHLEHLPIKDQLKIIVEGCFVLPKRESRRRHRAEDKQLDCKLSSAKWAENWQLERLGREFELNFSGSKQHAKKKLRLDQTYDPFALLPPPVWTHHARRRSKECGSDVQLRFAPGTYRTVVVTVVPVSDGKRKYLSHSERHKQNHKRNKEKWKRRELAAKRRQSENAMSQRRTEKADTKRHTLRKCLAHEKRT